MPGWGCDISGVRKWEDLPVEARNYVEYIEKSHRLPHQLCLRRRERATRYIQTLRLPR